MLRRVDVKISKFPSQMRRVTIYCFLADWKSTEVLAAESAHVESVSTLCTAPCFVPVNMSQRALRVNTWINVRRVHGYMIR